jgi:hypothetical protein
LRSNSKVCFPFSAGTSTKAGIKGPLASIRFRWRLASASLPTGSDKSASLSRLRKDHSFDAAGAGAAGAIGTGDATGAGAGVREGFGAGCFFAAAGVGEAEGVGRGEETLAAGGAEAAGAGRDEGNAAVVAGARDPEDVPGSGVMILTGGVEAELGNSALVGLPVGTPGTSAVTGVGG